MKQTVKDRAEAYRKEMFAIDGDQVRFDSIDMGSARYVAFKAGAEWERQKAIEAHWKCCPNLSKDNGSMCKHLADCNRECPYMDEFIDQLF